MQAGGHFPGGLAVEEAEEFADPEDQGGGGDDYQPVGELERFDVEKFSTEGDDKYLTDKYRGGDEDEASAGVEVESGASGFKGAGIEHVPELEEYEDCEEEGQFITAEPRILSHRCCAYLGKAGDVSMLKVIEEGK